MKEKIFSVCRLLLFGFLLGSGIVASEVPPGDLVYRFPTKNHALLDNRGEAFYMYCDRTFEGKTSTPWQAGGYGMVRNPFRASNGEIMYRKMHEGIDIKPMQRDAQGEPIDLVYPIAPGKVAYTCTSPQLSNYGRYVVVSHSVPEGTIYSLYAHLARVDCVVGQVVGTANALGKMGHSGAGINKRRSHVHLEICLMIHSCYDQFSPPTNKHGIFNGMNLAGIDPAPILRACGNGSPLSLSKHWNTLKEHYRVRVPIHGQTPDFLRRHPFLYKGDKKVPLPDTVDVAFTAEGVPMAVYPTAEKVTQPAVISCISLPTSQQNATSNRVKNGSHDAALTVQGLRYIHNFFWQKPDGSVSAPAITP